MRLPQPGEPGPCIYIPQEQGGSVIPPVTGFPFRRLLHDSQGNGGSILTRLHTGLMGGMTPCSLSLVEYFKH
jgi:hypothetical protein